MRLKFSSALFILPFVSLAQIIPIKTVPVATGDQFMLFPSNNLGIGGVSIAVEDEMLDPFMNPAKGSRITGVRLMSAPVYYSISAPSGGAGGSTSLSVPVGLLFRTESSLFGGVYWARQSMKSQSSSAGAATALQNGGFSESTNPHNSFNFGLLGFRVPETDISFAASGFWGDLNAIEGVRLLFPNTSVRQAGIYSQYQLGAVAKLNDEESIEATVVKSALKMRYDVIRNTMGFPEGDLNSVSIESNEDETTLWGIRLGYLRPLAGEWRFGVQITGNWKDHPKIPNYQIMSIPRDPGNSSAYNFGLGVSKRTSKATFGMDVIYEPIRTETWADAAQVIRTARGGSIFPGQKTVENSFNFSNWIVRTGARFEKETSDFQLGVQVHSFSYHLFQDDHVQLNTTDIDHHWNEWTLSIGFAQKYSTIQVRYTGLATFGTGMPIGDTQGNSITESLADFIPAVNRPLFVRQSIVFTHQISISAQIF